MNRINDWDKQILTAQDIARIFKCGKNLAYKIIESDDMNAVRIGSTVRIRRSKCENNKKKVHYYDYL